MWAFDFALFRQARIGLLNILLTTDHKGGRDNESERETGDFSECSSHSFVYFSALNMR